MHMSRSEFGTVVGAGLASAATVTPATMAQGRVGADEARAIYARGISIDALANPGSMNVPWPPKGPLTEAQRGFIAKSGPVPACRRPRTRWLVTSNMRSRCAVKIMSVSAAMPAWHPSRTHPSINARCRPSVTARARRGMQAPDEDRPLYLPSLNHPRRLEGVAELLARRGYSASVIEKVIGGNFHRVLRDIWSV
jgi:hypothetical protein